MVHGYSLTRKMLPQLKELYPFMDSFRFKKLDKDEKIEKDDIQNARFVLHQCGFLKARNSNQLFRYESINAAISILQSKIDQMDE